MITNKLELGYIEELIEHINNNEIKSFKGLVDYVCGLEHTNGYHGEYLEILVDHTDFFKEYFSFYCDTEKSMQRRIALNCIKRISEK